MRLYWFPLLSVVQQSVLPTLKLLVGYLKVQNQVITKGMIGVAQFLVKGSEPITMLRNMTGRNKAVNFYLSL